MEQDVWHVRPLQSIRRLWYRRRIERQQPVWTLISPARGLVIARAGDDLLAQTAQVTIFFSLLASIVTREFPENQPIAIMCLTLLALPLAFAFLLSSPLPSMLARRSDGRASFIARCRKYAVLAAQIDKLITT